MCHLLKLPWGATFDWERWSESALSLERNHPTIVCTYKIIGKAVDAPNDQLGRNFPEIQRKFLVAVRQTDCSVSTEHCYLGWINRFLHYHHEKHPSDSVEAEVASFLEQLALKRKSFKLRLGSCVEHSGLLFLPRLLGTPGGNRPLPFISNGLRDPSITAKRTRFLSV